MLNSERLAVLVTVIVTVASPMREHELMVIGFIHPLDTSDNFHGPHEQSCSTRLHVTDKRPLSIRVGGGQVIIRKS